MENQTIEERLSNVEKQIQEIESRLDEATTTSWKKTLGMFTGNEAMKQIDAAGAAIRQAERDAAKNQP